MSCGLVFATQAPPLPKPSVSTWRTTWWTTWWALPPTGPALHVNGDQQTRERAGFADTHVESADDIQLAGATLPT